MPSESEANGWLFPSPHPILLLSQTSIHIDLVNMKGIKSLKPMRKIARWVPFD